MRPGDSAGSASRHEEFSAPGSPPPPSLFAVDRKAGLTKFSPNLGNAMRTINIHAAKTQLSRLVDAAAAGEEIIIAKAGKAGGPLGAPRRRAATTPSWRL